MGQFVTRDAKIDIKKHCFSLHLSQNRRMADERKWASVSSGKVTFVVWPRSGWRGVQKQQGVVQPHSEIVPAPLCPRVFGEPVCRHIQRIVFMVISTAAPDFDRLLESPFSTRDRVRGYLRRQPLPIGTAPLPLLPVPRHTV